MMEMISMQGKMEGLRQQVVDQDQAHRQEVNRLNAQMNNRQFGPVGRPLPIPTMASQGISPGVWGNPTTGLIPSVGPQPPGPSEAPRQAQDWSLPAPQMAHPPTAYPYPTGTGPQTPVGYQPQTLVQLNNLAQALTMITGVGYQGPQQAQLPQGQYGSPYGVVPPTPRVLAPTPVAALYQPGPSTLQTPSESSLRDLSLGLSPMFANSPRMDPLLLNLDPIPDSTRSTNTPEVMDTSAPRPREDEEGSL